MTYRYGYYDLDGKPTLQEYILLEAKAHQTIVAPMDGVVSLDGDNINYHLEKEREQTIDLVFYS